MLQIGPENGVPRPLWSAEHKDEAEMPRLTSYESWCLKTSLQATLGYFNTQWKRRPLVVDVFPCWKMDNSSAMLGLLKRNKELIYIYLFDSLRIFIARYLRSLADNFNLKGTLIFAPSLIQIPSSHTQNLLLDVAGSSNPVKDFFNALTHTHTPIILFIDSVSEYYGPKFLSSIDPHCGWGSYLPPALFLATFPSHQVVIPGPRREIPGGATEIKEKTANKKQPSACMPFSEGNSTSNWVNLLLITMCAKCRAASVNLFFPEKAEGKTPDK